MIPRWMRWALAIGIALYLFYGEINGTRLADSPAPLVATSTTGASG